MGSLGQVDRQGRCRAAVPPAAACSTACSTDERRSSGRRSRSTRPESSLDSSSRFWASQSRRSSWARLASRNSVRADRVVDGALARSSLNVRSAAIGVRSSCETSARNSRLRSRSRRMISTLSWRRVGHRVELQSEVGKLGRAAIDRVGRDAAGEVALGKVVARLRQAPERRRDPAGEHGRDHDRDRERDEADDGEEPGHVGDAPSRGTSAG